MRHPKSMIHFPAGRRITSLPFIHGFSTSALGRPFGLAGRRNHARALSPGTSNGPPFVSPMKATPAFTASRLARVRSTPAPSRRDVRSVWISSTGTPSSRVSGGRDSSSRREKQISDTRTAAPSTTHDSSLHASKIRPAAVAACNACRFEPPRIELVATRPPRAARPAAI